MTRYLLDTNIISNLTKPAPSRFLTEWLAEQYDDTLFISSLSIAEIQVGILSSPTGKKRQELEAWFRGPQGPLTYFMGRVLPFDDTAALAWAILIAQGRNAGRPRSAFDMMIAAVAQANKCIIVTDNEKDFAGLEILNPMRDRS